MHRTIASLLVFATFIVAPLASSAVPITVPTELNPGDQYRLAFVTSTTRDATDTDITLYNAFVSGVANGVTELAALGTMWTAIASIPGFDARDNTLTNPTVSTGVRIYRLDNTRIADDNADLWNNTIHVPLQINEAGNPLPAGTRVWTGTGSNGIRVIESALGQASPQFGNASSADFRWVADGFLSSVSSASLYGMSDILTVIPEPSTIALAAFGFAALAAFGWRRRR